MTQKSYWGNRWRDNGAHTRPVATDSGYVYPAQPRPGVPVQEGDQTHADHEADALERTGSGLSVLDILAMPYTDGPEPRED